jgi:hypothetical protein
MPRQSSDIRSKQPPRGNAGGRFLSFYLLAPALLLCMSLCAHAAGPKSGTSGAKRDAGKQKEAAGETKAVSSSPRLDSAKVHTLYLEGEFDQAIAILEANLRDPRQYNLDDSIFIYKHLGVMYAASESTREKGRYYMHRLLMVEPTAKIMDMYASDMIYMIFRNIQEEFEASKTRPARPVPTRTAAPAETRPKERTAAVDETRSGKAGYVWLGAAALAVAAGVATWFYMAEEKPQVVVVDHQPE